jgi:hypothetical protein
MIRGVYAIRPDVHIDPRNRPPQGSGRAERPVNVAAMLVRDCQSKTPRRGERLRADALSQGYSGAFGVSGMGTRARAVSRLAAQPHALPLPFGAMRLHLGMRRFGRHVIYHAQDVG